MQQRATSRATAAVATLLCLLDAASCASGIRITHSQAGKRALLQLGGANACPCGASYVVQSSDSDGLDALARRCNSTLDALLKANSITNPDLIVIGTELKMPGCAGNSSDASGSSKGSTGSGNGSGSFSVAEGPSAGSAADTSTCPCGATYVVQASDSDGLDALARRCNSTPDALLAANAIADPDLIVVGTSLKVPGCSGGSTGGSGSAGGSSETGAGGSSGNFSVAEALPPSAVADIEDRSLPVFSLYTVDWAVYRNTSDANVTRPDWCKPYAYTPSHIDPKLATHINFAFALFNTSTMEVEHTDKVKDPLLIAELQALKQGNPDLKTLVSIAGWSFSTGTELFKFPDGSPNRDVAAVMVAVATDPDMRKAFVSSAIKYMQDNGFDGIDLDWEFPNFAQYNCFDSSGDCSEQVDGLTALAADLHAALSDAGGGLLTAAMRATPTPETHYNLAAVHQYFDHINLMSYDYHGAFDDPKYVNVHTPVLDCESTIPNFHIQGSIDAYLAAGVPASKLILGLSTYGRAYTLANSTGDALPGKAMFSGPGPAGECTLEKGSLAYYEIKRKLGDQQPTIDATRMAAYASYDDGSAWVGFDTPRTLRMKACYARYRGLGGLMMWSADDDDDLELARKVREQIDAPYCSDFAPPSCGGGGEEDVEFGALSTDGSGGAVASEAAWLHDVGNGTSLPEGIRRGPADDSNCTYFAKLEEPFEDIAKAHGISLETFKQLNPQFGTSTKLTNKTLSELMSTEQTVLVCAHYNEKVTTKVKVGKARIATSFGAEFFIIDPHGYLVCDDIACAGDEDTIPARVWVPGRAGGVDPGLGNCQSEFGEDSHCGRLDDGSCALVVKGATGSYEIRNALLSVIYGALKASEGTLYDGDQYDCVWYLFEGCKKTKKPNYDIAKTLPSYVRALRYVTGDDGEPSLRGDIEVTLKCSANEASKSEGCFATGILSQLASAVSTPLSIVLGVVNAVCSR